MTHWQSLYLFYDDTDALAACLRDILQQRGFTLYHPFGTTPGIAYTQYVRAFIAPAGAGDTPAEKTWTRILLEVQPPQVIHPVAEALSKALNCTALLVGLGSKSAHLTVYERGREITPGRGLCRYARDAEAEQQLINIVTASARPVFNLPPVDDGETIGDVKMTDLPDELQQMARQVNSLNPGKLFRRLSNRLMGGAQQDAAREMLNQEPDWNSQAGQYLRAIISCVTIPPSWREPDFATLRMAYSLHTRRQRNPDAPLLPGDSDALAAVPDALSCIPVYAGRSEQET